MLTYKRVIFTKVLVAAAEFKIDGRISAGNDLAETYDQPDEAWVLWQVLQNSGLQCQAGVARAKVDGVHCEMRINECRD